MLNSLLKKGRHILEYEFTVKHNLEKQLKHDGVYDEALVYSGKKVLVTILETNHYQHNHILGIAKILQLRGAKVKVLVCNENLDACEIKSVLNSTDPDPCFYCRFNLKNIVSKFGLEMVEPQSILTEIEMDHLNSLKYQDSLGYNEQSVDQCVTDSVVRYFYGDLPSDENEIDQIRNAHYKTAMIVSKLSEKLDYEWKPDIVIGNMAAYSAWEPIYKYFKRNGDRFRLISLQAFNFKSVTLNQFDLFGNLNRFKRFREFRSERVYLSKTEEVVLNTYFNNRMKGRAETTTKDFFDFGQGNHSKIYFDESKRNVFLFSNIYWDIGLSERPGLFKDVVSWVLETIEMLKGEENVHLYIRPHPGEVFGSQKSLKGVSQIIKDNYLILPNNLTIIEPDWKINTYDLFEKIDVGIIFTGTLGLEMMRANIPVVSVGLCTHSGLGFSAEPKTQKEYIDYVTGKKEFPLYKKKDLELFLYFYFIKANIPWVLTPKVYGEKFRGFSFKNLEEVLPGKNSYLDHLCESIMNYENYSPESW